MHRFIFLLLILPLTLFSQNFSPLQMKSKMIEDLDRIKQTFEIKYAPLEWKQVYSGWDLNEKIKLAKLQVLMKEPITVKDYQQIVLHFFASLQDYHSSVFFHSTELSLLPFLIYSAENRYFIAWIPKNLEMMDIPLQVGDEIILFGRKPIKEAVMEFKKELFGDYHSITDERLSETYFTLRSGKMGVKVPRGPITITVIHKENEQAATYKLKWLHTPEKIGSGPFKKKESTNNSPYAQFVSKNMELPSFELLKKIFADSKMEESDDEDKLPVRLGSKKSALAPLGEVLWESPSDHEYYAYLFRGSEGHTYGYIRLPSYSKDSKSVQQFSHLLNILEEKSDALVIDQLNNPGGKAYAVYAFASLFANKPLKVPTHRLTISQEEVSYSLLFLDMIEDEINDDDDDEFLNHFCEEFIYGYPLNNKHKKELASYYQFIINEWNEGRYLTEPGYLEGIETLTAHPWGIYTKPVIVLVNELDFSGGDFFPAILQDNKRALIFGTKTAGAGGCIYENSHSSHPNLFGISEYTMTSSLAERLDKNPIENLGVTPDIHCEITVEDLQNNYCHYTYEVNKALDRLVRSGQKKINFDDFEED